MSIKTSTGSVTVVGNDFLLKDVEHSFPCEHDKVLVFSEESMGRINGTADSPSMSTSIVGLSIGRTQPLIEEKDDEFLFLSDDNSISLGLGTMVLVRFLHNQKQECQLLLRRETVCVVVLRLVYLLHIYQPLSGTFVFVECDARIADTRNTTAKIIIIRMVVVCWVR